MFCTLFSMAQAGESSDTSLGYYLGKGMRKDSAQVRQKVQVDPLHGSHTSKYTPEDDDEFDLLPEQMATLLIMAAAAERPDAKMVWTHAHEPPRFLRLLEVLSKTAGDAVKLPDPDEFLEDLEDAQAEYPRLRAEGYKKKEAIRKAKEVRNKLIESRKNLEKSLAGFQKRVDDLEKPMGELSLDTDFLATPDRSGEGDQQPVDQSVYTDLKTRWDCVKVKIQKVGKLVREIEVYEPAPTNFRRAVRMRDELNARVKELKKNFVEK